MSATPPFVRLRLTFTLARRELRGGIAGFRVLLFCLFLGVGSIAAIGSLDRAAEDGIKADAKALLGGDVEARLLYRPAGAAEARFLAASGRSSRVVTLRAMARRGDGKAAALIELKAVDAAYPLYGGVALSPKGPLAAALARSPHPNPPPSAGEGREGQRGLYGAAVEGAVLDRLGLKLGDTVAIGEATFVLRAIIEREPDQSFGGLIFGPSVIISEKALAATGLIAPGALVAYKYRLRLPPGAAAAAWVSRARALFPEAGWQIKTADNAAPALRRLFARVALYLRLVGLSALLVGGVGIGNAVASHVAQKTPTIAILKCLGAENRLVLAAYLLQILTLALAALAAALVFGALLPWVALPFLDPLLPLPLAPAFFPGPLAEAALLGILATLAFALWPLAGIGRVPAAALFRDTVDPARRQVPIWAIGMTALAALGLAALLVLGTGDRRVALYFVAGLATAFVLFTAAGRLVVGAARRLPRPRHPALRLAIANLCRPGAPTVGVVVSLGIGLSVLIAIALVEGNIARAVEERLPKEAPAFFFIDIQPDQLAGFEGIVRGIPGARFREVPMLRGRITRLNGVPADRAKVAPSARWALDSDRGLTYAARLPRGSTLAAGKWWPPDYRGPPLVSFAADLARGMGLKVGDTLSVNLLGREITARIANLRHIDWARLGINFVLVFAPGTLEAAPQTHLAAVYLPPAAEGRLVREVSGHFPNVSAIGVREALAAVGRVLATIGIAVRLAALVTVASGTLVLGGAVAAGHRRRVYDAVVLKVLGATRGAVARAFLFEQAILGLLVAAVASLFGTLAGYVVVTRLMRAEWVFLPASLAAAAAFATLLGLGFGFVGTWAALGAKPAPYLRNG
ncbi:MAG TPA: FtsX-like permease family protein [Stellaceae bacterium]|nr:FtsX-like permease family protein [Stellaceae bacterium]